MATPTETPARPRRRRAWNSDPVVLTVAVTGADVFRQNNPNIPYTTTEIAESRYLMLLDSEADRADAETEIERRAA